MSQLHMQVNGIQLAARVAGSRDRPAMIVLHGWPQTSLAWTNVLAALGEKNYALAFDLPGVGDSEGVPPSAEKTVIADLLLSAAEQLGAREVLIVGYDVGGMVAYAAARDHAVRIRGAVVMNTVIPGIDPWEKILSNPQIWHFAFHNIPELPERLVSGHERPYFDFFYDIMAGHRSALSDGARDAYVAGYRRPSALKAGFDWYRAMSKDAERNRVAKTIDLPMLYLRGGADGRTPDEYVNGLRAKGARNLQSVMLPRSGEYAPEEVPDALITVLSEFRTRIMRE
jgi:pimeloyl-ACP methyl ester carboxylesterase